MRSPTGPNSLLPMPRPHRCHLSNFASCNLPSSACRCMPQLTAVCIMWDVKCHVVGISAMVQKRKTCSGMKEKVMEAAAPGGCQGEACACHRPRRPWLGGVAAMLRWPARRLWSFRGAPYCCRAWSTATAGPSGSAHALGHSPASNSIPINKHFASQNILASFTIWAAGRLSSTIHLGCVRLAESH